MTVHRAFGVKAWVIQNLLPVIGGIKVWSMCTVQSDVQPADIPEHFQGNGPVVRERVILCRANEFVP